MASRSSTHGHTSPGTDAEPERSAVRRGCPAGSRKDTIRDIGAPIKTPECQRRGRIGTFYSFGAAATPQPPGERANVLFWRTRQRSRSVRRGHEPRLDAGLQLARDLTGRVAPQVVAVGGDDAGVEVAEIDV